MKVAQKDGGGLNAIQNVQWDILVSNAETNVAKTVLRHTNVTGLVENVTMDASQDGKAALVMIIVMKPFLASTAHRTADQTVLTFPVITRRGIVKYTFSILRRLTLVVCLQSSVEAPGLSSSFYLLLVL